MPKGKGQNDKQRSAKHTHKTTDQVPRTPLKSRGELMCSGRVSISCSTNDTRRVNLVTNPVINNERGKEREVFTRSGRYPWSFVTQIFHNGQSSHGGDRKTFKVMILGSITSLLAATLCQGNSDRNHNLWNIV